MLRRKFIKTSLVAFGGTLVLVQIPLAGTTINENRDILKTVNKRPKLNLSGHKRSGCATRPELAAAFEDGYGITPF